MKYVKYLYTKIDGIITIKYLDENGKIITKIKGE